MSVGNRICRIKIITDISDKHYFNLAIPPAIEYLKII